MSTPHTPERRPAPLALISGPALEASVQAEYDRVLIRAMPQFFAELARRRPATAGVIVRLTRAQVWEARAADAARRA